MSDLDLCGPVRCHCGRPVGASSYECDACFRGDCGIGCCTPTQAEQAARLIRGLRFQADRLERLGRHEAAAVTRREIARRIARGEAA